jgi:hypothetical protein
MTNAALLGSFGDVSGQPLVFRNKIINGGFDIWQRGTSQTATGYGSDDRWLNLNLGSTKTASRQTFTVGQTDVPGNPSYWARTVVTTSAGSGNYCTKQQKIENVATLSGQVATLSFWAKADATKNIAVEFLQEFGTGGIPSASVSAIGVTTVALTTTWQRYTVTATIPSISGKTLGTNNDSNFQVIFWFDAGSSFNSRTNSLGQQSGTFDIANVQLEAGSAATPFEQRPVGMELSLCQRYYWQNAINAAGTCGGGGAIPLIAIKFPVTMRSAISATSQVTYISAGTISDGTADYPTTGLNASVYRGSSTDGVEILLAITGTSAAGRGLALRSATLGFSAEL